MTYIYLYIATIAFMSTCCSAVGDSSDTLEKTSSRVHNRYQKLCSQVEVTKAKVIINNEVKLFYDELTVLLEVLTGYEKWINMQENIAEDVLDLNRQMEQCRVCDMIG